MKSSTRTHVFLTGGLGNQLFQVAAALELSKTGSVVLHDTIGSPRVNELGLAEIESLQMPSRVKVARIKKSHNFISKVAGFNLRSGFDPSFIELKLNPAVSLISSAVMTVFFKAVTCVKKSSSLGYDEKVGIAECDTLLIGYFQTYKYVEKLGIHNFLTFPGSMQPKVSEYLKLSQDERPLVVHVRLGDYAQEDEIGILNYSYYESALWEIWNEEKFGKIWLFSDEPEQGLNRIPSSLREKVRIIDSKGFSSAETLEVMSFGHGFIIANSSFGWWGATLRRRPEAIVCAPNPWFQKLEDPRDIVPPNWMRISGFDSVE